MAEGKFTLGAFRILGNHGAKANLHTAQISTPGDAPLRTRGDTSKNDLLEVFRRNAQNTCEVVFGFPNRSVAGATLKGAAKLLESITLLTITYAVILITVQVKL